ncbi:AraC family transcriptional regulator N-terminal domain-containing protein [Pseudomonas sp.]|jgi:AraC-like DNA-binding protein|uniref:AraC family transcriptional regulator n=1 Tax=Pseudomonas sp. TaxID=306 RepID=UPI003917C2EE
MPDATARRTAMVALMQALAPCEGYNLTALPDVRFLRCNRPLARTPVLYEPGIVIVCQGSKRGFLGGREYRYDAQHYLAVSVPVPFNMETAASEEEPLLAIYLRLDMTVAAELLLQLGDAPLHAAEAPASMISSPLDEPLAEALLRLLKTLGSATDTRVLGAAQLREIYYRVLSGAQGPALRAAIDNREHFGRISAALQTIHQRYREPLDIQSLAAQASMSAATFHLHFKSVTATTPIQYLKSTRLHRARLLMLQKGVSAAQASYQVGYESPSHFGREFKRLFGLPPQQEVERLRATFSYPLAAEEAVYVSSH